MDKKGFSLIELIVSMGIMAILIGFSAFAFIGGRNLQQLVTAKDSLIDLVREAKITSFSPEFGQAAKAIAVYIDESGTASVRFYRVCGGTEPPCDNPSVSGQIHDISSSFDGSPVSISRIYFREENCGSPPCDGLEPAQAYIFYSIPFGKACITTDAPTIIEDQIDEEYPVNGNLPDRFAKCQDATDAVADQLDSYLYIDVTHENGMTRTIRINTYSGDVSDV